MYMSNLLIIFGKCAIIIIIIWENRCYRFKKKNADTLFAVSSHAPLIRPPISLSLPKAVLSHVVMPFFFFGKK